MLAAFGLAAGCSSATTTAPSTALNVVRDIALPGTTSRFDYQSFDPTTRTLWIAHLGEDTVIAVNLTTDVAMPIGAIAQVHGVLAVPERHVVYATATGSNEIVSIDPTAFAINGRAPTGMFPDGLASDPDHQLLLGSNRAAGTVTVHDPASLAIVRTVAVGHETGNVVYDPLSSHAYAATLPPDALVEFDPATGTIIRTTDLAGCDGAHGVAINPQPHVAYVACESNARLATVDLATNTAIGTQPVGNDPDVLSLDTTRHRLYVAAESGDVTILDTNNATTAKIGGLHLAGAHSVTVEPTTGQVLLRLANLNGRPTLRVMK